jgi:hypothetical protein
MRRQRKRLLAGAGAFALVAIAAAAADREGSAAFRERTVASSVERQAAGARSQLRQLVQAAGLRPVPASSADWAYPEVPRRGRAQPVDLDCPPQRYGVIGDHATLQPLAFELASGAGVAPDAPAIAIAVESCRLERLLQQPEQRGRDWEEIAWVVYREGGVERFRSAAGLRLHGGRGRTAFRKSFRLYFRPEYGAETFLPGVVTPPGEPGPRSIVVHSDQRSDGQRRVWRFVNSLGYDLAMRIGGVAPRTKPVALLLNGTPRGAYVLGERVDRDFVARYLPHTDFDLLAGKDERSPEALTLRDESLRFVVGSPRFDLEAAAQVFDVDSLLRWYAVVVYCGTSDAFQGFLARDRRSSPPVFRMIHWDLDLSFQVPARMPDHGWQKDLLAFVLRGPRGLNILPKAALYRLLTEDPAARDRLARMLVDAMNHEWSSAYLDERLDHYERTAAELGVEDREYQTLLRDFVARRQDVVLAQLREHLGAASPVDLEIADPGGTVLVDGRPVENLQGEPWRGRYLAGMTVSLAIAPGDRTRWRGFEVDGQLVEEPRIELRLDEARRVRVLWAS